MTERPTARRTRRPPIRRGPSRGRDRHRSARGDSRPTTRSRPRATAALARPTTPRSTRSKLELEAEEAGADDFDEEEPRKRRSSRSAPSGGCGRAVRRRGRRPPAGRAGPSVQRAPTQSELAVRVTDNASRVFVIATVVVFAAILLFGMLAGNGGVSDVRRPTPTAAPSASVAPVRVRGAVCVGRERLDRERQPSAVVSSSEPSPAGQQPGPGNPGSTLAGMTRFMSRWRAPRDPAARRAAMVAEQLRARGIRDERVLAAMGAVPREHFVPEETRRRGLRRRGPADRGRPDDQPAVHGRPHDRAARRPAGRPDPRDRHGLRLPGGDPRLARCAGHVASSGRRPDPRRPRPRSMPLGLGDRVEIRLADGSLGDPTGAPWDGIIVTAAAPAIPDALREQLADGGRLVIPVGPRDRQILTLVTRHGDEWTERPDGGCVFVPLIGAGGFEPTTPDESSTARAPTAGGAAHFHGHVSVYSAGHDPRLRRAPPGRRRPLVRRPHREPARARPERHDPDGLLGRRRRPTA